jgi:hypothetical protein
MELDQYYINWYVYIISIFISIDMISCSILIMENNYDIVQLYISNISYGFIYSKDMLFDHIYDDVWCIGYW